MKKVWLFVIIIAVIIVAALWFTVSVRNSLIAMDESVNANWSQIEAQLQRRRNWRSWWRFLPWWRRPIWRRRCFGTLVKPRLTSTKKSQVWYFSGYFGLPRTPPVNTASPITINSNGFHSHCNSSDICNLRSIIACWGLSGLTQQ